MSLNAQQIETKNRTIGGSDVAALFGESPWAQPMDVWMRVTGRKPLAANDDELDPDDPKAVGSELEDVCRGRYRRALSEVLGEDVKVQQRHQPKFHVDLPYLAGNIDADVVGHRRLGELKVCFYADRSQWGEPGTDEVPAHYALQVHTYLLLHDYEVGDLFAWFGRNDWRRYELRRHAAMDELILDRCRTFWTDYVETDTAPPVDVAHPRAEAVLRELYPGTNGQRIVLPEEAVHYHAVLRDLSKRRADIEASEREMRARLLEMVGENAVGLLPNGGGYARKLVKRDGYTVEPTEYMQFRFSGNYKPQGEG